MANSVVKKQAIISQKDLNLITRILKSNWWIPLVVLPIFFAIGRFYVYRLTTVYKASTEILLKSDDTYYKNSVLSDANFLSSYIDNSNEIRILQSYDISNTVVEKLQDRLLVSYFIVGKVRTTEFFSGMPFHISVNSINPGYYEKVFDFRILNYNNYEITFNKNGKERVITGAFNKPLLDIDLRIQVDRDENLSEKMVEPLKYIFYQFTIHSKEYLVSKIRGGLSVENPQYTRILKISLKDPIPERAVIILDTLNKVYADSKLQTKYELNDRTILYIDKQLSEITFSLKSIEDTMQNYKEKKSIIDLSWQQTDFLNKISTYDGQKSQLKLQLQALDDLEKYIVEDKDPQFLPPSVFISEKSGFMTQAVTDLYSKQIELNKMANVAKENNPAVQDLKNNIIKTKQDLLVYINNTRKAALLQIRSIETEILDYINEARMIPSKQREMLNIQRRADVSGKLYDFLLEKKASAKIARAGIVPDLKIVEAPRAAGIDSPDKSKIEKQFLSAGLLLSVIIIILRSAFYQKIKTVAHLQDLTNLPLIGVLPRVRDTDSEGVIVEQRPNSAIAESFRNFRTNLQYTGIDRENKTYLITSFLPGEGKTFTSVNLASILAKTGKKTVILELDLHKPKVHQRFGLSSPPTKGITTYVNGADKFEDIISETYIPNLFCIYSGLVPPNPSEFVLSEKMKELITQAKKEFDYVIIDTPPAGLLSDSIYLMQYVDSSIFVLNTRSSTKKVINFLEDVINANKIHNVLLLLNGVATLTKRRYYYQGYGYSYGYGYGYGYGKGSSFKK